MQTAGSRKLGRVVVSGEPKSTAFCFWQRRDQGILLPVSVAGGTEGEGGYGAKSVTRTTNSIGDRRESRAMLRDKIGPCFEQKGVRCLNTKEGDAWRERMSFSEEKVGRCFKTK